MEKVSLLSKRYGRTLLLGCAAGTLLLFSGQSAVYAAGETSTSMTVLNIEKCTGAPITHLSYTVDTIMTEVTYYGHLGWMTSPYPRQWGQTLPNGVTGNLWAIKPSKDGRLTYSSTGGEAYSALSWDYLGNATTSKHLGSTPIGIVFTMNSSLCEQGSGACASPAKRRTTAMRWPEMIEATGDLRIEPPSVGVFDGEGTQQFKLYDGDTEIAADNVDWWISEAPADSQGLEPDAIATIDGDGLATIISSKGTVKVSACYPKGCGPVGSGGGNAASNSVNLLLL